jgi:ribosomal protein S7
MPRRAQIKKRELLPDSKYGSLLISLLINKIMYGGKKSVAEKIVYGAMDVIEEKEGKEPLSVLETAFNNVTPLVEVRPRRVGGATYQVPVEVRQGRNTSLAIRWGYVFEAVDFTYYGATLGKAEDTRFVDIAFDPDYTSALPQLYVAIASDDPFDDDIENASKLGNLWFVSGEAESTGPGEMDSGYIFFRDEALGSVQVSGSTIMVQNAWTGAVYTTNDHGNSWPEAKRSPAGQYWGHLLMSPNYATNNTVYAASFDANWTSVTSIDRGGISGFYRSTDGAVFFDGISLLDMPVDYEIVDLAFDPKGGSQPVLMVINSGTGGGAADYIFYTADATAANVQWLMKDCMTNIKKGPDPLDAIGLISWDGAGDVVMLMGLIGDDYLVFRSYDEGNSFSYWRVVPFDTVGVPVDWVVVDNNTISVAGVHGYWGTRAIGTEIKVNFVDVFEYDTEENVSIARYGDKIAIGNDDGSVLYSSDAGKTWPAWASVGVGQEDTFVAFGPDGTLYAASSGGTVTSVVAGKTTLGADTLIITGESPVAAINGALSLGEVTGIWVSPDNALYVMGSDPSSAESGNVIGKGTITLGLPDSELGAADAPEYIVPDAKLVLSAITVTKGSFNTIDPLEVVAADVKAVSSSIASGTIWVSQGTARGYFTVDVYDSSNPFVMFSAFPADLSVTFGDGTDSGVYISGSDAAGATLSRLLLGEKDNVWEQKALAGAARLWGTTGSNLLWSTKAYDDTAETPAAIWALEDFNSGKVQNVTVKEIDKDATKAAKTLEVSWTALPCTTVYEIYVDGENYYWAYWANAVAGSTLRIEIPDMDYATSYDVQVRAGDSVKTYGPDEFEGTLQSRLSAVASVTTECYNVAPTPQVPVQGMQDASLAPSFVWAAPTAGCAPAKYDFQLSTDPNFGSFIIDTTVTGTGYTYTARDLAYDTDHYWRVRSVAADGTKSNWTTVQNFHTMIEPVEPVPPVTVTQNPPQTVVVTVPPPQTFTIPAPQTITVPPQVTLTQTVTSVAGPTISVPDQPTPAYIWVIVAVGAVLTIAVIVLIVRTRRAE